MLWFSTPDGKYRLESLSPASFAGALRVIRESFCQDEYISRGSEVNKNPVATEELLELCADAALDGVSLVVIDNDTEEVTAVAFNKIQVKAGDTSEKPFFEIFAEQRCTQGSSRSLIQFMANVDERCNLFQKYNVDCSLEIMFLATLKEHRYKKLGFYLCKYSIEVAKSYKSAISEMTVDDLGPQYRHIKARHPFSEEPKICQAIWTSSGSQKIGKALDFTVHLTVPLSEFVFNGQTYAERLGQPEAYCEVAAYRF
ncbi:uncharacterized protein LOC121738704 [Aricia agestis]|uniref:uncharacterized protein LOC121738704 n=1 Tax=Aricia agestis TaxID=91739 RepID=UPI001C208212|nr:uncharacterized protein LOC121738704 [Aricia agestis]